MRKTLLGCLLCFVPLVANGGKLYWVDRNAGKVQRSNLDGSEIEILVEVDSTNLRGIAIDVADDKLYFADNSANTISKATLDGDDVKVIVRDRDFPADVTLDLTNRKLYWCDQGRSVIERANLDGSGVETVVETPFPYYLELDVPNNFLYWGDFSAGNINRRSLDGGTTTNLFKGQPRIRGVKLDRARGELFWCNRASNHIQRRLVNGGPIRTVITDLDTPHGLVIDPVARKAYWCDTGTDNHNNGGRAINRADLDVPEPLEEIAALSQPWDADLDLRTTTYAQYVARYFRTSRSETDTATEGDFDQDGASQLLEYGLASHPERRDLTPQVAVEVTDGKPYFVFQRFSNVSDLSYQIEVSSDMETWESNGANAKATGSKEIEVLAHGVERVKTAILTDASHGRLRVVLDQ
ncbi:DUF5050 domain-containing protein [Verrucomicrobiales bacterium]|jgi:DNA-binding beta-propeller fold protein YncE|nr:DUF5050 domain-containing protein [Verrucomicrobiales bacterium]MDB2347164.1 DUF5050 domain-containing protein [Verrucomicrobiales bacterium]MDC0503196.1 DUF5050 domain-containing protein [Verrucomicrobiales bacterium]MDF1788245.1 DUF5050 domain-containing protein [Verrucomicrobiales bacterium]